MVSKQHGYPAVSPLLAVCVTRKEMKTRRVLFVSAALALSGSVPACTDSPEGWTPVLEETSTSFLSTETERALERVRDALSAMEADPAAAEASLRDAERALVHLQSFYLPLLGAREQAYNAYRHLFLGEPERVVEELEGIEETLAAMAGTAEENLLTELESLAGVVADARMAAMASRDEAAPKLLELARRLDMALVKGDVITRAP